MKEIAFLKSELEVDSFVKGQEFYNKYLDAKRVTENL